MSFNKLDIFVVVSMLSMAFVMILLDFAGFFPQPIIILSETIYDPRYSYPYYLIIIGLVLYGLSMAILIFWSKKKRS